MKAIINDFLLKLQPEYPKKITVNYDRGGEPIPMPMDSGEPIPMEMDKGNPIPLAQQEGWNEANGNGKEEQKQQPQQE